jgi:hypothetical protein
MTAFGKVLAFVNLIVGVGLATWAITLYAHRPGWFDTPTEGDVARGHSPLTFKQLSAEIDTLGKTAATASQNWGASLATLKAKEKLLAERRVGYAQRIEWAKKGNPQLALKGEKPLPGFFEEVEEPGTKLINLGVFRTDKQGRPLRIPGPDSPPGGIQPLQGADTLLDSHHLAVTSVAVNELDPRTRKPVLDPDTQKPMPGLLQQIKEYREQQKVVQVQVLAVEARLLKQLQIRTEVQYEVLYLRDFKITVGGQQETVYARKKQLEQRLREVVPPGPKGID